MEITVHSKDSGTIIFPPNVYAYCGLGRTAQSITNYLVDHVDRISVRYASMKEYFEYFRPTSVLDVGCGFAVIDVLLARFGGVHTIHLLDGDGTGKQSHSFDPKSRPWYNVEIGHGVVAANVPNVQGGVQSFAHTSFPTDIKVDLIISTRAWGHHFPVEMYVEQAKAILSTTGSVILDIRRNTNGKEKMLEAGFLVDQELPSFSEKCSRFIFVR